MSLQQGRFFLRVLTKFPRGHFTSPNHINRLLTTSPLFLNKNVASFEEVKAVKDSRKVLLIDVREPNELVEYGTIPGSINIPLGEVESVLRNTSPEEFQKKYGRAKPEPNTEIIFSCMKGKRSADAQERAMKLGFKNIKNYQGGWVDWAEKIKSS